MKKITREVLLVALLAISGWGFSQTTVDFETVGNSWSWIAFSNGAGGTDNQAGLTCPIANPATTGINASANCLKFVEAPTAAVWGGLFSLNVGTVTITEATKIVKVMVYKSRLSPFTLKLEGLDFGDGTEFAVPNTVINEWQELSFDLTAHIGKKFSKLVLLPDQETRSSEVTIYMDNIVMPTVTIPVVTAPTTVVTPTVAAGSSIFVYSSNYTYTPFAGLELAPDWGQVAMGTVYAPYSVGGKNVLSYLPLAYQGMAFDNAKQDVSAMKYLHFDIWTVDASATPFRAYLIGTVGDNFVDSDIATDGSGWVSLDIPLSKFADGGVGLNSIRQLKFQCAEWSVNGANSNKALFPKIYIDNIYFWTDVAPSLVVTPGSLNIAATASNTITFGITTSLGWTLESDQTWLTASSASGTGNATITLTSTDNTALAVRTANVTVTGSDASVKTVVVTQNGAAVSDAPTPTVSASKVKAVFSDAYTPVAAAFDNWYGTDMTEESSVTPANKVKKVSSICCFGYNLTDKNLSSMTTLHVDIYPTTLASLNIGIVSNGEKKVFKNLTPNQWNSINIPLADYTGADLANVAQIGFWDMSGAFYMDNLYFYNSSTGVSLTLNVDTKGAGLVAGDKIYVAGTFPDWVEPGQPGSIEMLGINTDGIYSVTLDVPAGTKAFKFFKNAGWNGGEWIGDPNRSLVVNGDKVADYVWGSLGLVSLRDNKPSDKIRLYPNPVRSNLFVDGLPQNATVKIYDMKGKLVVNRQNGDNQIDVNNLSKGVYSIQIVGKNGITTKKFVKE
jgi:hypothetical protein